MRVRGPLVGLLCWLILTCPCLGWGPDGHRIVAALAADTLSREARAAVRGILGDETLAELSTWPDEARDSPEYEWTKPLHYINVPRRARAIPPHIGDRNVVAAIGKYAVVVADESASRKERREALGFLVHFVGDIHQPLHVSYADDRGGNDTAVELFGEAEWNLHAVWDSGLLARRMESSWVDFADALQRGADEHRRTRLLAESAPRAWADESLALVRGQVYDLPDDKSLGDEYYARNIGTVEERLTAAGVRLGALLNSIFQGDEAVRPYVADPATIEACTLRLFRDFATDVVPPGGGRNLVTLTIGPEGAAWSRVDSYRVSGAPERSGRYDLAAPEARELLAESLAALAAGGWFDLPREVDFPRVPFFEARRYRVQLEVRDGTGSAYFERVLPYGAEHADRFEATAAAAEGLFESTFELP